MAGPQAFFQGQRQTVLLNVNLATIFFPTQFLYEREQGIARVRSWGRASEAGVGSWGRIFTFDIR